MTFLQRHAYGIGCGFAAAFWPFFFRRRRISVENILRAGITADRREARRIARRSFCHFAGHMVEAFCVPGVINRDNWREHLDCSQAPAALVKLLLEKPEEPVLIATGHHGCWEAATNILSLARPMIAIARVMDSRLLQNWMKNHHFRGPVTIINKNNGFSSAIIGQWKRDRAALAILMDQYTYGGSLLKFFSRPARTVTSVARLAIRYGCPVAVGSFVRIAPYRYRIVGGDPVVFPPGTDRDAATQLLNDRLEEAVRAYPEQYLWMHRRWRDD